MHNLFDPFNVYEIEMGNLLMPLSLFLKTGGSSSVQYFIFIDLFKVHGDLKKISF